MSETAPAILDYAPPAKPLSGTAGQYLLLNLGVFACATSVLFLKAATTHPMIVSSMRLLIAAAVLSPLMVRDMIRSKLAGPMLAREFYRALPAAILLAVHMMLWSAGARMTPAAHATLIVNLSPVALPFVMFLVNRERINQKEIIGTTIAMSGVIALMGQGIRLNDGSFHGDIICFVSMLIFCFYLALGRRAGAGRSLWMYVVPVYGFAGLICLATAFAVRLPWPVVTQPEVLRWIGLGLVPTVIGHSIFNHSIKHLRGQTVSTINLSQVIYAGVLAYVIFGEIPPIRLYVMAAVIAVGVLIVIRASPLPPAAPEE